MTTDSTMASVAAVKEDRVANPLLTDLWLPWVSEIGSAGDPNSTIRHLRARQQAIYHYSWAIPSDPALAACIRACDGRPLVELGSGTGYWAKLLSDHGVRVTAVESRDSADGSFSPHFPSAIREDAVQYLDSHQGCSDKVLFLCWPRNATPWLEAYHGDTVVWVGETDGCTWRMPSGGWEVVDRVPLPTWGFVHDYLLVYKRKLKRGVTKQTARQLTGMQSTERRLTAMRLTMSPRLPVWVPFVSPGSIFK